MSLTPRQIEIIKSCVPILEQHGFTITKHFYSTMIEKNPDLRNIFSTTHQATGHQPAALAQSLYAYASNIDNLGALGPVVELICHKHVSLHIEPQHYDIVGSNLLAAMGDILGDALTPEVLEAWAAAYGQLAKIMIDREAEMYKTFGSWDNWRDLKIVKKERETDVITSFYLVPVDDEEGKTLPSWKPGQYVSVRVPVEELGCKQPRQYSLSDVPGKGYLRISVKRELGLPSIEEDGNNEKVLNHPGWVSNLLHDKYNVGDIVEVTHPTGDFFYEEAVKPSAAKCPFHNNNATQDDKIPHKEEKAPLFLLAAGVGITPMISILNSQFETSSDPASARRPITFIHGARNPSYRPFTSHLSKIQESVPSNNLTTVFFNSKPSESGSNSEPERKADSPVEQKSFTYSGRVNLDEVKAILQQRGLDHPQAQFFICGPNEFMENTRTKLVDEFGVPRERVFIELFGTGGKGAVQL